MSLFKNKPIRLKGKAMGELRARVFERDGNRCRICGNTYWLELAHIIARGRGGEDSEQNTRVLCARCHRIEHSNGTGLANMHY